MYREENGDLRDGVMIGPKVLTPAVGKKPAVHCPLIVTFCPWLHGMTEHQFTKIKDKWKEAQEYKTGAPHSEFNSQMACVKPAAAFIKEMLMDETAKHREKFVDIQLQLENVVELLNSAQSPLPNNTKL